MKKEYWLDNETGTFTMTNPETGKYWYNQLWNDEGYITSVSHVGNGISRYLDNKDAKQVYLNENDEKFLYLRDEESHDFWNIGISPTVVPVENYICEHGQQYTKIASEYKGIKGEWMFTVPEKGTYEIWKVTLQNTNKTKKTISIFPYIKFDLGGYRQPAYYNPPTTSATMFIEEMNGILCWSKNPHQPHNRCSGFLASSEKVIHYDGWLERFNGTTGNFARPEVLVRGKDCTDSLTTVRIRGAVLQNKINLEPGETKTLYYFAGFTDDPETAVKDYTNALRSAEKDCQTAFERGVKRFGTLRTATPIEQLNNVMNFWAQKQVSFCGKGKKAVRDNAQITMGMLNFNSELAEGSMYECLCHQYSDGHAVLTWSPELDEKLYSDPPVWLILAVCEVIKETGNMEFLYKEVPYLDGGSASVYDHLKCAVSWLLKNKGPHGLPLIHYADWNDALNIPDENAESVFMAMGVAWAIKELEDLADFIKDEAYKNELEEKRNQLIATINSVAWNGDYYVRALSKFGVVGDKDSIGGGNIYINPQTWSILGDVVLDEYRERLYEAIDGMDTDYGIPICKPSYKEYYKNVGRMSGMLPGVYENGGIYNHAVGFKIMADCKAGRKEEALQSLIKVIPDGKNNPSSITTTEPYVFTNCYLMHEAAYTVVGFSWLTGASAWALRGFYEGILGLRRTYSGLQLKPQLSEKLDHVKARRIFRHCEYEIEYFNNGGSALEISVDGNVINGDVLPLYNDGKVHKVIVNYR